MAIWQYTLLLIPAENFEAKRSNFSNQEETGYLKETHYFWEGIQLNLEKIIQQLDLLIPETKSTSTTSLYWKGNSDRYEDNDCSIYFDNQTISSFTIRFDLRKIENSSTFISFIHNIALEHNLLVMNLKYEFFEPTIEALHRDILHSRNFLFLENPTAFFEQLNQENKLS